MAMDPLGHRDDIPGHGTVRHATRQELRVFPDRTPGQYPAAWLMAGFSTSNPWFSLAKPGCQMEIPINYR